MIDDHINTRHAHIKDKKSKITTYFTRQRPSIKFNCLIDVLKNVYRDQDYEYWNMVCFKRFDAAYKEHLTDLHLEFSDENSDVTEYDYLECVIRLEKYRLNVIKNYLPNNFIKFLRMIHPHEVMRENYDVFYSSISNANNIQKIFLEFLQNVSKPINKFTLSCGKNSKLFQPSCISFVTRKASQKRIAVNKAKKGLADNYDNSYVNENIDYIVVENDDDEEKILTGLEKFTEVGNYDGSDKSNSITQGNNVYFVSLNFALGEINE